MFQLVAATNFINPNYILADPDAKCSKYLSDLGKKSFRKLKSEHIADYQKYFKRFAINLGPSGREDLPTDARIREVSDNMDNSLAALYVQYGRYLMLASSRRGNLSCEPSGNME